MLSSKSYIPKRIIDEFDRVTSSMIENGLHQFYWKFTNFLLRIRGIKEASTDVVDSIDFCKISLDNFHFPLITYVCLMALALLVFVVEIGYSHYWSNVSF